MNEQPNSNTSDFASNNLLNKIPRHDKDINWIKKKLGELEDRVGDNESFGSTFASAKEKSTVLNDTVKKIIEEYDNHKIKSIGIAVIQWIAGIVIGAVLMQLANQVFITPQTNQQIEALRKQIESYGQKLTE